jgi:hypothetical protein
MARHTKRRGRKSNYVLLFQHMIRMVHVGVITGMGFRKGAGVSERFLPGTMLLDEAPLAFNLARELPFSR